MSTALRATSGDGGVAVRDLARPRVRLLTCLAWVVLATTSVRSFSTSRRSPRVARRLLVGARARRFDDDDDDDPTRTRLPPRLVESLDLVPLAEAVASHCGTRRGADAVLRLVGRSRPSGDGDARRGRAARTYRDSSSSTTPVLRVARSAEEAAAEYALVAEATRWLSRRTDDDDDDVVRPLPPLYGTEGSPFRTDEIASTDDDEFLRTTGLPYGEQRGEEERTATTMENLLRAEQVLKRAIDCHDWAARELVRTECPGLAEIGTSILRSALVEPYEELRGAVVVRRDRSVSGAKGYVFEFDADVFPVLRRLRAQERRLARQTVDEDDEDDRAAARSLRVVRDALAAEEDDLRARLSAVVRAAAPYAEEAAVRVARLDATLARAAFGLARGGGVVPEVGNEGVVRVERFAHPLLRRDDVVPVDLLLSESDLAAPALVVSGPNGGGKTLAPKSFGVAAVMVKTGVPLLVSDDGGPRRGAPPRVDFFRDVLVEVGDRQSVEEGESTLLSRLNAYSSMLRLLERRAEEEKESSTTNGSANEKSDHASTSHSLLLLDELGGGTDPAAGAALARAVLETALERDAVRAVVTTHSARLKTLPLRDARFRAAAAEFLEDAGRPSFRLLYDVSGDSRALAAAERCRPPLPERVRTRAAELLLIHDDGDEEEDDERALRLVRERAADALDAAERARERAARLRSTAARAAEACETRLRRAERRLESLWETLRRQQQQQQEEGEERSEYEVIGDVLWEVRLRRREVTTEANRWASTGLRPVPANHVWRDGELVVVLAATGVGDEWEGATATVVVDEDDEATTTRREGTVVVRPSSWSGDDGETTMNTIVLDVNDVALWDDGSYYEDERYGVDDDGRRGKGRLIDLLNSVPSDGNDEIASTTTSSTAKTKKSTTTTTTTTTTKPSFVSARQRKAAAKQTKNNSAKTKNKNKKKSKR